jgi:hypothetical protein
MPIVTTEPLVEYYLTFRSAIFTSSLTLGTFLFTMKTFIIINMKKEVYDKSTYRSMVQDRVRAGKKETLYGALKRLKRVLFWAILLAIGNALIQITIGYLSYRWAAIVCFSTTALSWAVVTSSLLLVSNNISDMLEFGERDFAHGQ